MGNRRATLLSLCAAAGIAATVALGLWNDYTRERQSREQAFHDQAETLVRFFDGAMRSHRRNSAWFCANITAVLEDLAAAPGIRGLAIYDPEGQSIASWGRTPPSIIPSSPPPWTADGLLAVRESRVSEGEGPHGGGRGLGPAGGGGWGRGAQRDEALAEKLAGPVWIGVLVDDADYRQGLGKERRQFLLSLGLSWGAVLLGLGLIALVQRHSRLAEALSLAGEREARLEEMARLGAGLAHETKNPLSLIRGLAQSWMAHTPATADTQSAARRQAGQIVDEVDRVVGRINSFLNFARPATPDAQPVDLGAILQETATLFSDEAAAKGIELRIAAPSAQAMADANMVRQVVVNLLANALAACRHGDAITVELTRGGDGRMAFAVNDTGEGIAPDDLPQVTKPYFSRRPGGTGLGLAIVDRIVRAHGWRLEIESPPGQGVRACVRDIAEAKTQ